MSTLNAGDPARLRRIAVVTLGLVALGAVAGAVTGAIAATLVMLLMGVGHISDLAFGVAFAAALGAPIGAVILPLEAWMFMRRAPLWRALVETATGTIAGSVLLMLTPAGPIVGAVIGFTAAAIRLRVASPAWPGLELREPEPRGENSLTS